MEARVLTFHAMLDSSALREALVNQCDALIKRLVGNLPLHVSS
jgi:hypothetical protein